MLELANPKRFMEVSYDFLPWTAIGAAAALALGFYLALFVVPPDYQQGDSVRIMFIHVPAAWSAMAVYVAMVVASVVSLIHRHPLADVAAKTAAYLGALFTALALVTGSLWGKPMWGTFWVWDARLTSFFILLLIYLAYIEDETRAARACAILAIVGAVNLPIIEFSVDWWNTLHQGESIFRAGGPLIAPVFLWPLAIMALGYTFLFLTLWMLLIRTEIIERRIRTLLLTGGGHE